MKATQTKPKTVTMGTCIDYTEGVSFIGVQATVNSCDSAVNTVPVEVNAIPFEVLPKPMLCKEPQDSDSDIKESDSDLDVDTKDPNYVPDASDSNTNPSATLHGHHNNGVVSPDEAAKYLVFESCLLELFVHCPQCGSSTQTRKLVSGNAGTLLRVEYSCVSGHTGVWLSQPLLKHRMAAGNLLLSAAILFTGASYERIREIAEVLHMPIMCENQFYAIQDKYLFPIVHTVYTDTKEALLGYMGDDPTTLLGDGRCDSPGFSAKYGTYNIMDAATGAVLTFSLKQVNANTSSVAMEADGCFDGLKELLDHGMVVKVFGTDCSTSIAKLLRENFPDILHEHDVYHIEKRIKKMLLKKANKRGNHALHAWIKPVTNQLWWVAQNCNHDANELREKWISIMYHVTDLHEWDNFDVYHKCEHAPLSDAERSKKKWLRPDSSAHKALKEVVLDRRLVADIKKLTHAVHTGGLEAFHSLVTKYTPKRQHFSYKGMLVRTELAVLDHNNNLDRGQATTAQGNLRFDVVFPKRTKDWLAKPVSEPKSHKWRRFLASQVVQFQCGERTVLQVPIPEDIPKNIADITRPPKEEVVSRLTSRFAAHPTRMTSDNDVD